VNVTAYQVTKDCRKYGFLWKNCWWGEKKVAWTQKKFLCSR